MNFIEQLGAFGLTKQEATIYTTLLTDGAVTGYEAAKLTGISRSNTYNALAGLVEKGAAYIIEGSVTKYTPVDPKEFCDNEIRNLSKLREQILMNIPDIRQETDGYITIKGEKHIMDKLRNMLLSTNHRVYLSVSKPILKLLEKELDTLIHKGIKVVVITQKPYEKEGAIIYYNDKDGSQIRLITDSMHVLTGELTTEDSSTCLYSKNDNLVAVFKEMLQNEIKLIQIHKGESI